MAPATGFTAEYVTRLARRAGTRRPDGSRGPRARWAWRRLVRACATGDTAAQDAVREGTAELSDADVLDLLAAAPVDPPGRAAYLALVGQGAQRQALDPDGALLALAYRAGTPGVRERLRTVLAAEGDADVVRVVVTGEQRDRIAEMSYGELDYLGRQLAEHRSWDELRRLARDLPLAKAAAAVGLLPEGERRDGSGELYAMLAERSPETLRATAARLPRHRLITRPDEGVYTGASFSPDGSELAVRHATWNRSKSRTGEIRVTTLSTATGNSVGRFACNPLREFDGGDSVLHLGDQILLTLKNSYLLRQVVRAWPDSGPVGRTALMSDLRRSSRGAVLLRRDGLAFVDRAADGLRTREFAGPSPDLTLGSCGLATRPSSLLLACGSRGRVRVLNENGRTLHAAEDDRHVRATTPVLSFLGPDTFAVHYWSIEPGTDPWTVVWEFSPEHGLRIAQERKGTIRDWSYKAWRDRTLDDAFAARVYTTYFLGNDFSWPPEPTRPGPNRREVLAMSLSGDAYAVGGQGLTTQGLEVHTPHLPAARELLERPLLHCTPRDLQHARGLMTVIRDPEVRDALGLLADCLTDRFHMDIALGDGTGTVPAGGATDIALGDGREG